MTGYKCNGMTIGVEFNMPYRKKPCLVIEKNGIETKYASFNNTEAAIDFMNLFAQFLYAAPIDWTDFEKVTPDEKTKKI